MLSCGDRKNPVSKAATGSVAFALLLQLICAGSICVGSARADSFHAQHSPDFDPFAEHAAVVSGASNTHSQPGRPAAPGGAIVQQPSYSVGTRPSLNLPGYPQAATTGTISTPALPTSPPAYSVINGQTGSGEPRFAPQALGQSAMVNTSPDGSGLAAPGEVSSTGPIGASTPVKASATKFRAKSGKPRCHGDAVLPLMVHMAQRPELIESRYLSMILGAPDNKGSSGFGASSLRWGSKQIGSPTYALQNGTPSFATKHTIAVAHPSATSKTFVAQFAHSGLQLKHIKAQLGEPTRRYFDDQAHPVESYQFSPNAVLTFTEPANNFDVTHMSVIYNGPPLALPSAQDYGVASQYRLTTARHLLASGNTIRCAELLNQHLKDYPQDAGAHLILAKTMKHYGDINGALDEYRTALTLARTYGVSSVEKEAYGALLQFGVVANPAPSNTKQIAGRANHS